MLPDLLRALSGLLALALVPTCVYCMFCRIAWDQRVRFAALILYGSVIVGAQIENWGEPMSWRMPFVLTGTALALLGAVMFLVRRRDELRGERDGG